MNINIADQYRTYSIGDPVLIYLSGHRGEMSEGRVIHMFDHEGQRLYVIEFATHVGEHYECRSGHKLCMRPAKGSPEYESWAREQKGASRGDHGE